MTENAREALDMIEVAAHYLTDEADLRRAFDLIKARHSAIRAEAVRAFTPGEPVKFTAGREVMVGYVEKVNRKTVGVIVRFRNGKRTTMNYRVSPDLLHPVSDEELERLEAAARHPSRIAAVEDALDSLLD